MFWVIIFEILWTNILQRNIMDKSQNIACPVCDGEKIRYAFTKDGYDIHRCNSCASLFVHPLPEIDNESKLELCHESSRQHLVPLWREVLSLIENSGAKGPLLDMGCGAGQFLHFAEAIGWSELTGIELNEVAADKARSETSAILHTTDLFQTEFQESEFSVITLWDVIEHLHEIEPIIERLHQLLRSKGVIVVTTHNASGLSMRLLGRHALTVMPPEHLTYMPLSALTTLIERLGFEIVLQRSFDIYLQEWLRFLPQRDTHATYQKNYGSFVSSSWTMRIRALVNIGLNMLNLGDELLVVARKK